MTLVGFHASNHPQQPYDRDTNDRALPPDVFEWLNERFHFSVDVAASSDNRKCERFYSPAEDGLTQDWSGENVYCNPPFTDIQPWIEKAWSERFADVIVMLLPANRTEQQWWQRFVEPYRDRAGSVLTTEFLPGRIRFLKAGQNSVGPNERPPFGIVLCIWRWAVAGLAAISEPRLFEGVE